MTDIGNWNADIVIIKSLYFEAGSERFEPGENTVACMASFLLLNCCISYHFNNVRRNKGNMKF